MKRTITLPISPETRAALEKAGWTMAETGIIHEVWTCGEGCCIIPPTPTLYKAVEFAAILGIAPKGYRIIPEETAADYLAARTAFFGQKVDGDPGDTMKRWTGYEDAEETLAIALGGARLLPPHQAGDGGLSPSPLHPDAQAMLNTVQNYLASYDTDRMTRKLQKFMEGAGEGTEPREEETP